jgi:hypothetical protein
LAERVRFELTGLSSSGFQVWVKASVGVRRRPIHEGIGLLPRLESASVRLCCYRLLLPVIDPGFATTALRQMPLHIVSRGCSSGAWSVHGGGYLAERDCGGGTFGGGRQKKPVPPLRSLSIHATESTTPPSERPSPESVAHPSWS